MKARVTFDTLAYANRLKAAGLESKIAETQAEANAEMLTSLMEGVLVSKQDLIGFATKQDLSYLATKKDVAHLEAKMELRLNACEEKFEARFNAIDSRFNLVESKITTLDSKVQALDSKVQALDSKVQALDSKVQALDSKLQALDAGIKALDVKFNYYTTKEDFAVLLARIDKLGTQITVRLGGIVISVIVGLTAFLSYFHLIH